MQHSSHEPGDRVQDGRLLLLRRVGDQLPDGWWAVDLRTADLLLLPSLSARTPMDDFRGWVLELEEAGPEKPQVALRALDPAQWGRGTEESGTWALADLVQRSVPLADPPSSSQPPARPTADAGLDAEARQLLGELTAPDPELRVHAASLLGRRRSLAAAPALVERLTDEHPDVRRYAAEALGRLSDRQAIEPLLRCLQDPDSWVRQWAAGALHRLGEAPRSYGYQGVILIINDEGEEQSIE